MDIKYEILRTIFYIANKYVATTTNNKGKYQKKE